MIKLCLTILIILCLIYLIYIKEQFTTCNSELVVNSLLINGSFNMKDGNPVANIFWKIPNGLKKDDVKSYFIIYKNVADGKDVVLKIPNNDINENSGIYKYELNNLDTNSSYNITVNLLYEIKDKKEEYLVASNTLILKSDEMNNEMIQHLSDPNEIFSKLKNKTFDIYL
jgi:hypothetical protein